MGSWRGRGGGGGAGAMDTWQSKWEPPRSVHKNPCLVVGCTDKEALKEAFEKHGTVEGIQVPEGQNFAFVRFEDKYAAEVAMKALDGTAIAGSQVTVTDGKCSNKAVWNGRRTWPRRPSSEA